VQIISVGRRARAIQETRVFALQRGRTTYDPLECGIVDRSAHLWERELIKCQEGT
jgi:hypothetical protein